MRKRVDPGQMDVLNLKVACRNPLCSFWSCTALPGASSAAGSAVSTVVDTKAMYLSLGATL